MPAPRSNSFAADGKLRGWQPSAGNGSRIPPTSTSSSHWSQFVGTPTWLRVDSIGMAIDTPSSAPK